MKLVQSAQSYLTMLGMNPNQRLVNVNFFVAELIIATNVTLNWLFLIYEANTFREYTNAIFLTSTITIAAVCFTIFATESEHIFNMINIGEKLIEKSEQIIIVNALLRT